MFWRRRYAAMTPHKLGRLGEKLGARFLRGRGHRLVVRNYTYAGGEIDLVTEDQETLVFVEIKTRRSDRNAFPEEAVGPAKRRRLTAAARHFLLETGTQGRPCRFDVLAIVLHEGQRPQIEHFVNAFPPAF